VQAACAEVPVTVRHPPWSPRSFVMAL
jgi:hypothetical protein